MTQALAARDGELTRYTEPAALVSMEQLRAQINTIKATIAPKGTTDMELELFLNVCVRTGLDPLLRQIYPLKMEGEQGKLTIHVGIDGARLVAHRSRMYAGQTAPEWCGPDGIWHDVWLSDAPPAAARVGIRRWGCEEPIWGVATYREFVRRNRDGQVNKMWQSMPANQLAKCAEMQGIRKAFPNEFSSIAIDIEASEERQIRQAGARVEETRRQRALAAHVQRGETQGSYAGATIDRSAGDAPDAPDLQMRPTPPGPSPSQAKLDQQKRCFAIYAELGGDTQDAVGMQRELGRILGRDVPTRAGLTADEWRRCADHMAAQQRAEAGDGASAPPDPFHEE